MSEPSTSVARVATLTHRYGDTTALGAVTLDIPGGRMVGFIGPDGVGKSSLLALIAGAKKIQSGRVEVLDGEMAGGRSPNAVPKLADFCLSKSYMQTGMSGVTMVGDVAGTIAYMPPEQVRDFKEVRPPSDIYSVGMTAYSMLTAAHPLDIGPKAGISETVKAIFERPVVPIDQRINGVPRKVAAVFETALNKQVEQRWRSAGAMREALLNTPSDL